MLVQNEDSTVHCKEVVKIVINKQVKTAGKEEHRRNRRWQLSSHTTIRDRRQALVEAQPKRRERDSHWLMVLTG